MYKNLLDKLNIEKNELKSSSEHEYFQNGLKIWHANLVSYDRRKAVVLMNNETRYPVVIYRPKPKDFKSLDILIKKSYNYSASYGRHK